MCCITRISCPPARRPRIKRYPDHQRRAAAKVTETRTTNAAGQTVITTTYDYDGVQFNLEAEVDAVQTHNAADAILSAWGVRVNITNDGRLSLQ